MHTTSANAKSEVKHHDNHSVAIGDVNFLAIVGELVVSTEGAQAYNGVWELCPQRVSGAEPLKAENILTFR